MKNFARIILFASLYCSSIGLGSATHAEEKASKRGFLDSGPSTETPEDKANKSLILEIMNMTSFGFEADLSGMQITEAFMKAFGRYTERATDGVDLVRNSLRDFESRNPEDTVGLEKISDQLESYKLKAEVASTRLSLLIRELEIRSSGPNHPALL